MLLSNDPNRANSEAARLGWFRNTLLMYCQIIEAKLNQDWIPDFEKAQNRLGSDGDDIFIAYDHMAFEDRQEANKRVIGLKMASIITANEGSNDIGLPDHPDGDKLDPVQASNSGGGGGLSQGAERFAPGQNDERAN